MALKDQLKVMVVDDTSVSRMLVIDALQTLGVRNISFAKDGAEALKAMMANPAHLVISDLNMPKLDGIGLLKGLREYKPTSKIGFILLTGVGDKATIDRARQYGLNNYVAKPFTPQGLKTSIEAVFGRLG
jgi:two-component system, chemotaxis family, chemotaxis protein CheY